MSSWADVAAKNAPPESEQPKPDPALLEGGARAEIETTPNPDHENHSVSVVPADYKEHPTTEFQHNVEAAQQRRHERPNQNSETSAAKKAEQVETLFNDAQKEAASQSKKVVGLAESNAKKDANNVQKKAEETSKAVDNATSKTQEAAKDTKKEANNAASRVQDTAQDTKKEVNNAASNVEQSAQNAKKEASKTVDQVQTKGKQIFEDVKKETSSAAKDAKRKASELEDRAIGEAKRGKKELEKLDDEVHREYNKNPQLYNSLLGVANFAVIGGLAYFSYTNWNRRWEPKNVAGVVIGASAWFGLQSLFGFEEYKRKN